VSSYYGLMAALLMRVNAPEVQKDRTITYDNKHFFSEAIPH